MISATVTPLSVRESVQGIAAPRQTRTLSPYHALVEQGFLRQEELALATSEARRNRVDVATVLMDRYRIPKPAIGIALADFYHCPFIAFDERTALERELLKNLSLDYLRMNHWVPLRRQGNEIEVLIDDPHDPDKLLDVRRAFPGQALAYRVGLRRDIEQCLNAVLDRDSGEAITDILGELVSEAQLEEQQNATIAAITENDSAIVRLANQIITEAYRQGASDIHIEPYADRKETTVRFRVDGTCFTYMKIPAAYRRAIVSRVKIMASLDIAERRKPQDGKIRFKMSTGQEIELRVATLPTAGFNEDVVIRLLSTNGPRRLDELEFGSETRRLVGQLAQKPHGIVLCAGPTGSGKTTTLHAILASINTDERKIWTAEDPIEITQDGLRQVQVHSKIGLTFAATMRAFLRADPDVIMIGKCVTRKRRISPLKRPSPDTWSSVRSIQIAQWKPSSDCWTWGATLSTFRMLCWACWQCVCASVFVRTAGSHITPIDRNSTNLFRLMGHRSGRAWNSITIPRSRCFADEGAASVIKQGTEGECPSMS